MNTPRPRTLAVLAAICGCSPSFEDQPWRVDETRIVAISSTPAEARPGEVVALQGLVVGPEGPSPEPIAWSFCTQPRLAEERTAVTASCLEGEDLLAVTSPASLLPDACARFGPNPPPTEGGVPPRRPADPDPTGGYYIPVEAALLADSDRAFGLVRVRCDLAAVTRAVFEEYEERYTLNENPVIESVELRGDSELRVRIAGGSAEAYVMYDEGQGRIVDRTEVLTVRWYVTDGELSRAVTTVSEPRAEGLTIAVPWEPPASAGSVHGWVVVTDDRGGTAFAELPIAVGP